MDNDSIYPNFGEAFTLTQPKDQAQTQKEKTRETLDQLPLVNEVIEHLGNRIEATDSVKQTLVIAETYKISREQALVIADIVRQQLETEKGFIMARISAVKR